MKPTKNRHINRFREINRRASILKMGALLLVCGFMLLASCKDDALFPDNSGSQLIPDSNLIAVDLPGILGVKMSQITTVESRADNTSSDGRPFSDGLATEYELAMPQPEGGENYHYLLLYDKSKADAKPLIFPIEISEKQMEGSAIDNITLTISKVYQDKLQGDSQETNTFPEFKDKAAFKSKIEGMQAYALLNFKLTETGYGNEFTEANYISGKTLEGNTTAEKLSKLTQTDLQALQLRDYKIKAGHQGYNRDYFIMSSSVYSNNTNKIIDGIIDGSKIFSTEEEARNNPAVDACVERVAAKVTVTFNTSSMGMANFDPYGDQKIISVETNPETGLPIMNLVVQKVDMDNTKGTGIVFDNTGYRIVTEDWNATIKILGYGLSNTEPATSLIKNINPYYANINWMWTDPANRRSYWSQDANCDLKPGSGVFTRAKGYPHQFRQALDTDSITSYHIGADGNGYTYEGSEGSFQDEYEIGGQTYSSVNQLGTIDLTKKIEGVFLNYKSFENLNSEFKKLGYSKTTVGGITSFNYNPIYTLENTYYDPGMFTNNRDAWIWPWHRVPYGVATNLIVLAEIDITDKYRAPGSESSESGEVTGQSFRNILSREGDGTSGPKTVYLGQNNIFYLSKWNLLKSKLTILNEVMLSGGNAGIQVLHGSWDAHKRWTEDDLKDVDDFEAPNLDKIAWNEGSKLWFAEMEMESGKPVYEPVTDSEGNTIYDSEGNTIYKAKLKETWLVDIVRSAEESKEQDLDLIPAELSGGDGQCLIAPNPRTRMGMKYKYYLAPIKTIKGEDGKDTEMMDEELAVEISYNHLVALIHKIIGPIDVYREGKMYFSVPIPHNISSFDNSRNNTRWARFGSFSLVRNNWYNISVTQITSLGTPVENLQQPIVPVMDVKRSYINMGVELLNWHELNEDNIPIM